MNRNLHILARYLRLKIGAHHKLTGTCCPSNVYQRTQSESDAAVAQAKYLIQQLADRHQAVCFANAVGMPGYINMR